MTIDRSTIDSLTALLTAGPDRPLTGPERDLIAGALRELAAAQSLILKQSILLESFDHDTRRIEEAARRAVDAASARGQTPPVLPPDAAERAAAARRRLVEEIERAASLAGIIGPVLRFIAAVA